MLCLRAEYNRLGPAFVDFYLLAGKMAVKSMPSLIPVEVNAVKETCRDDRFYLGLGESSLRIGRILVWHWAHSLRN